MWWLIVFAAVLLLILKFWPKGLWLVLLCAALLLAGVLYWQHRTGEELASVQIEVTHDRALCPADKPLSVTITNRGKAPLERVLFSVHARVPGYSGEVTPYTYRQYESNRILEPGESHAACYRIPPLSRTAAEGMDPSGLAWSAEAAQASFR